MNTNYILYAEEHKDWVYVSYIADVYYKCKDIKYMLSHQNKREALIIGQVFFLLGYNVKVALFCALEEYDDRKYKIIFGLEPNFIRMCRKNPDALKIYYATGSYWKHQSGMVKLRTDEFNRQHNAHIKYSRLVEPHESCQLSDFIFQIGSSFTIQTYPEEIRHKIKIVNQSSNLTIQCDLAHKLDNVSFDDFIWMGTDGSILKGLAVVHADINCGLGIESANVGSYYLGSVGYRARGWDNRPVSLLRLMLLRIIIKMYLN